MFRRKLQALDYHSSESIDVRKPDDLKALIVWLEDQKLRHYKIDDRAPLRNNSGNSWTTAFKKYLTDMECPFNCDSELFSAIDWLLGVAVRYEYNDAAETNQDLVQGLYQAGRPSRKDLASAKSPLDIDPGNEVFVSGVQALAKILQISSHPNIAVALEACKIVIEEKLSSEALERASQKEREKAKEKMYNITPKDCGFEFQDPVLGEAAKVLRLLHIQELRYLQTNINELIVAVQNITANPKTDQSLGQVGR